MLETLDPLICTSFAARVLLSAVCVIPCYADCASAFTWHWVGPGAAERTCCGVQTATGYRYSASLSPALPRQPEGRPGPTGPLGSAPASPPAGTLVAVYCTAGRL